LNTLISIFLGGGLGAIARFGLSSGIDSLIANNKFRHFPFGILACNLIGCFLIGWVIGSIGNKHAWSPLLITGFLGGFTTFSTFGKDSQHLLSNSMSGFAILNIFVSVGGGLLAVWLGLKIATNN